MDLDAFLKQSKETTAGFAGRVQSTKASISRIRSRKQVPSLALAVRISEATGGQVTERDLLRAQADGTA